jgi:hypothetical protein
MPGVPRELLEHEHHVSPNAQPIKQLLHHFTEDKKDIIKEIARLLDVSFIRDVYHSNWLSNSAFVPKKNKE